MSGKGLIDTVIIFRILKKLVTPWEKTDAFKTGLIDKHGRILVKKKERTPAQKKSMTTLDRLVFNLKRLLAKVPGGATQLGSYVAALALIREHVENESNKETSVALMERLEEQHIIPPIGHDLSTPEGYLDAMEEEIMRESSVSGASFGGAFSGAGPNGPINDTGRAGSDPMLFSGEKKRKKTKMEKILRKF